MKNKSDTASQANCCSTSGCCDKPTENLSIGRRHFIGATGMTAAALMAGSAELMAGPFKAADFENAIPVDKKLSKEWIAGLYARGEALSATGEELAKVGMPISGICTGQVYLAGDGRLWYWNVDGAKNGKINNPKGPSYMKPLKAGGPHIQGFAIQAGGKEFALDASGFKDVTFTNQYPMATVDYADGACPVTVQLQAYTPFIPLNRDDSSYPVVVMRYTITNPSSTDQEVALAGWIENFSNWKSGKKNTGKKLAVYRELDGITTIECSAKFDNKKLNNSTDAGSIALALLGDDRPEMKDAARSQTGIAGIFTAGNLQNDANVESDATKSAFASLGKQLVLKPGESRTVSFAISWHMPRVQYAKQFGMKFDVARNHYATQWSDATDAAAAIATRGDELYGDTQKWMDTWYDSTLPYWFLERTFVTVDCVQTQVGQRLAKTAQTPEYYNFDEGVKCCPGNCTHVWHYAQGLSRIFPEIERECRDKVEFGLGFDAKTGEIHHRYLGGKFHDAIDGNCGTILRVLRESQMTTDYTFLESMWDRVKLAMDHVIAKWDSDEDGMLSGAQHNTLDQPWYGQVHWHINMYHAALKATALMARQMKQPAVAARYDAIVTKGAPAMVDLLWNEDFGYFIHKPGEGELEKHGSTNGCHIDQVLGDSWLRNVGIDPILPEDKIKQSLQALWKFNFTPDVGAFRKIVKAGRWYAGPGDAGLVMCSFPHGKILPKSGKESFNDYLNECMTGFEWQVAAHMIWEGMLEEGLAIGKAIYDRYVPKNRNPYNEIECSDHYSRAMASYGAYLAACGYQYDGPEGKLAFGPRISPEKFRAAFTTAEGWGRFTQAVSGGQQSATLDLHYGTLTLNELALDQVQGTSASQAKVEVDGKPVEAKFVSEGKQYILRFANPLILAADQRLNIKLIA